MNIYKDELGLDYSATNQESVVRFNDAVGAYLASRNNVMPLLDELLDRDPEMSMAVCFRGYLLKLASDPRFVAPIGRTVTELERMADTLSEREKRHLSILKVWSNNQIGEAVLRVEDLLSAYPRDMLALRIAHYLHFYAGASVDMRDSVARSLERWHPSDPFYGYLLGMHSFGLEESGDYDAAERVGREAVDLNQDDIWAAHAVTHVFQMQERFGEGIRWIESLIPMWINSNNFIYHLHWHKALLHLGLGEREVALGIYDDTLTAPIADDFYLDICNAASLLWRLEMAGIDVGERWQNLHDLSIRRITDNELVFSTLHYLMTPAVMKDERTLTRALSHFESWSKQPTTQGELCAEVGLPLARAIADIGCGNYERATRTLSVIKNEIYRIGGSHAQRHLFDQLLAHYSTR